MSAELKGKEPDGFTSAMWWCAGVDRDVLVHCPSEWSKFTSQGMTICMTAIFAALSGGYALSMIFESFFSYILFGLFWGALIFTLDRSIVTSIKFDENDGAFKKIWKCFPRIVLALFIGVVVSTPLELKIFEDSIREGLRETIKVDCLEKIAVVEEDYNALVSQRMQNSSFVDVFDQKIKDCEDRIERYAKEKADAYQKYLDEMNGTNGTGKKGTGPESRRLLEEYEQLKIKNDRLIAQENIRMAELEKSSAEERSLQAKSVKDKQSFLDKQIAVLSATKDSLQNVIYGLENGKSDTPLDFTRKLTKFHEMARSESLDEEGNVVGNDILFWSSWLIRILFVIVEILPTLLKMFIQHGQYEFLIKTEFEKVKDIVYDERITATEIAQKRNSDRFEIETKSNEEFFVDFFNKQKEVMQDAVRKWRDDEWQKMINDPEMYLKKNVRGVNDHLGNTKKSSVADELDYTRNFK